MRQLHASHDVEVFQKGQKEPEKAAKQVINESSIKLIVNGEEWLSFICSPSDLEALAVGYLWNEGLIKDFADVDFVCANPDYDHVRVTLKGAVEKPARFARTSTGFEADKARPAKQVAADPIKASKLIKLYEDFSDEQAMHEQVGGFHSAGLCDSRKLRLSVEDLGRHNCVDKIAGLYLMQGQPFEPAVLCLSGRISSEMVWKSLQLQVPFIVSRTTPTSTAVAVADQAGITLVGYMRDESFIIYSHPENVRS